MAFFGIMLDIVLVVLLGAVLAYAVMLNRKLGQLRSNKDELARVINAFNEATQRAEASIPRLRKAADEVKNQLEERIEKAVSLKDDLAFMIDRGDSMANRLESSVRMARGETMGGAPQSASPRLPSAPRPMAAQRPSGGFAAQSTAPSAAPLAPSRPAPAPAPAKPAPSLSATGGSMTQRREPRLDGDYKPTEADLDDRSEAERALLRALQSAR